MRAGTKKNTSQNRGSKTPNVSGQNSNSAAVLDAGGRRRRRAHQLGQASASPYMTTTKERSTMTQLTYEQAAGVLDVSPRHVRRLCKKYKIRLIIRGHRTVRIAASKVASLRIKLALEKNGGAR
jgi:hypothetical protein